MIILGNYIKANKSLYKLIDRGYLIRGGKVPMTYGYCKYIYIYIHTIRAAYYCLLAILAQGSRNLKGGQAGLPSQQQHEDACGFHLL